MLLSRKDISLKPQLERRSFIFSADVKICPGVCRNESNSCGILSMTDWQTSTTIHAAKCHCQMLAGLNLINNHNLLLPGCTFNIDLTENQI